MRLKLTIISPDVDSSVCKEIVFEHQGGVIGRKQGNDWVLPDAKRFISSKHALIRLENNGFQLGDLSTNGVYLNNAASPIGDGNFVSLTTGDQFKIGDYNILVCIEEVPQAIPDVPSNTDVFPESNEDHSSNINIFAENVDPLELLGSTANNSMPSLGAAGEQSSHDNASVDQDFFQPPQFKPVKDEVYEIPTNWDQMPDFGQSSDVDSNVQPGGLPEHPAISKERSSDNNSPNLAQQKSAALNEVNFSSGSNAKPSVTTTAKNQISDEAIKSFLRGVGISPEALDQADINNVMFDFGRVLRTTVQGLMEILSARSKLKSEFRMNYTTIRVKENNPLKFSMNVDDALSNLFVKKGENYLMPVAAIDEAIKNMKDHQIALLAGMQAALKDLVQQFDPVDIEKNREKYMEMSSKIPVYRKAKSWDLYCQSYSDFKREMGDNFQDMFGNAFTEAYEKQISDLLIRQIKR